MPICLLTNGRPVRHRYDMIYRCNSSPLAHSRARVLYGEYGIAGRDTVAVRWQVGRKEGREGGREDSLLELVEPQNTVMMREQNRIEPSAESRYRRTFLISKQASMLGSVSLPLT